MRKRTLPLFGALGLAALGGAGLYLHSRDNNTHDKQQFSFSDRKTRNFFTIHKTNDTTKQLQRYGYLLIGEEKSGGEKVIEGRTLVKDSDAIEWALKLLNTPPQESKLTQEHYALLRTRNDAINFEDLDKQQPGKKWDIPYVITRFNSGTNFGAPPEEVLICESLHSLSQTVPSKLTIDLEKLIRTEEENKSLKNQKIIFEKALGPTETSQDIFAPFALADLLRAYLTIEQGTSWTNIAKGEDISKLGHFLSLDYADLDPTKKSVSTYSSFENGPFGRFLLELKKEVKNKETLKDIKHIQTTKPELIRNLEETIKTAVLTARPETHSIQHYALAERLTVDGKTLELLKYDPEKNQFLAFKNQFTANFYEEHASGEINKLTMDSIYAADPKSSDLKIISRDMINTFYFKRFLNGVLPHLTNHILDDLANKTKEKKSSVLDHFLEDSRGLSTEVQIANLVHEQTGRPVQEYFDDFIGRQSTGKIIQGSVNMQHDLQSAKFSLDSFFDHYKKSLGLKDLHDRPTYISRKEMVYDPLKGQIQTTYEVKITFNDVISSLNSTEVTLSRQLPSFIQHALDKRNKEGWYNLEAFEDVPLLK